MGQLRHGVPLPVLLSLALLCEGCGGSFSGFPPPPPAADFTLNLSSNSISITQAAASSAINVSVNPMNGFSGAVQVALNALPSGVTSNPASPFSVAAGATTLVVIAASANAATGNFTISVQGTSGALAHSASLAVAIQSAVNPALPRTAYARTDSTSASDDPFGEPHHRHLAYDSANKHLFIANRAMNRVDVFSTAGQSPYPAPTGPICPPMAPEPRPTAPCLPSSQKARPKYAPPIFLSFPFPLRLSSSKSRDAYWCPVLLYILQAL